MNAGWRLVVLFILALGVVLPGPTCAHAGQAAVGLQVVPVEGGGLTVLQVVARSPADRAGMRPGDLVVVVNGQRLTEGDFQEVTQRLLWGRAGSSVTLVYLRPGQAGSRTVTLSRADLEKVPPPPAGVKMLSPAKESDKEGQKP